MRYFVPVFISILILTFLFFCMKTALYISNRTCRKSIMKKKRYTADSLGALMTASYGSRRLIKRRYIQVKRNGILSYQKMPFVLITGGGVTLVTVCEEDGEIDNRSSVFTRIYTDIYGNDREENMGSPIADGQAVMESLHRIFEKAALPFPVPVTQAVVFTSRKIYFTAKRQKELLSPPEAVRMFDELYRENGLSKEQIGKVKDVILHYTKAKYKKAAKKQKR